MGVKSLSMTMLLAVENAAQHTPVAPARPPQDKASSYFASSNSLFLHTTLLLLLPRHRCALTPVCGPVRELALSATVDSHLTPTTQVERRQRRLA